MPKRTDINKILIIGSGPIVIGQGCEFDYSGTQACKALRRLGYKIVLVNSNPATIMTDPGIADSTYIEPLNVKSLKKIIAKEMPDAVLPNLGGQMALNLCSELSKLGVLEKYGVKVIGVQIDAIERGEDRIEFKNTMAKLGIDMPRSMASYSVEEAERIADELGYPVVIRPAYTMGGTGGGLVYNIDELRVIAARGIAASMVGQILVEESVLGWEELELEVVRDSKNQMITVCFIENIDAVGVHTGDSICSAPMLTISDELQKRLQKYSYDVVEAIDVIGGTNVQFAHDPKTGRVVIIEINPRTSRSSALASKATGFPIAYVSCLLAAGLTLDEIPYWRDGTLEKYTPSGDYVVIKFPRWAFEKFPGSIDKLGTQMRAVGEVMSIGKNYKEAMQKAIRSLEIGRYGLGFAKDFNEKTLDELLVLLAEPSSERQFILYEALRKGADVDSLYSLTYIKPYFLEQMKELVQFEEELLKHRGADLPDELLIKAKKDGFADRYLSKLLGISEYEIREKRTKIGAVEGWEAVPVSGVENASYYFSTYNAPDTTPVSTQKKVMILGGGPNRIGQGIEFDYCCVHAAYTLKDLGYETVMVNCNPETVSTDYDTSDKLYFEPLTVEDVLSIYEKEKPEGIIVSFGGQTPLNIAGELEKAGVKILGTSQETIDLAEDRDLFRNIMEKLDIPMPESGMAVNVEEAIEIAHRIGYPLMVRPSYVLGGRGMKVVHDDEMLRQYMVSAVGVTKDRPILVDRFLKDATEAEADAIADGKDAFVPTVMEHIEYAGIHSGDSACVIPPISIREEHLKTIVEYTKKIAKEMKVVGLMNMQYAIEGDTVYVLEANPRGSRTVPLVSKVCNIPMASIATEIIMAVYSGENCDMSLLVNKNIPHYGVKEAVLPFNMFPEVHPVLGPEMRSTGEVLGMADSFELAYVKAQESTSFPLPTSGTVLISVNDNDKQEVLKAAKVFMEIGFKIRATKGTCAFLQNNGVNCEEIKKLHEGRPNISDSIYNNEIKLIINTPSSRISEFDDISICMLAVRHKVPYITTMTAAFASAKGIKAYIENNMPLSMIRSLQEYHANIK
ncbi:carbamoyl-phosphate synthase large subunit [Youngiibacter multivorans]|uniref:Carbamoyl-phosphate synthase large subunit n=1 Tax=Youngiibacter multivorans TaxID=937251 RepID=A0ABS4G4H3_9CLOT|nr:carbamoyl-phosphate synthase large subunit [Youngiibacter multivorans]MBP1919458.1 carbamoyl-phosphate synthase large subunit [Youngiibacter multivorans]